MKTSYRFWGAHLLVFGTLIYASVANAQIPPAGLNPPPKDPAAPAEEKPEPRLLNNLVLNYDGATTNSREVLNSKVTVDLKSVSFLAALETVMQASSKTCRIECRELTPLRLSIKVKDAPVAGLLDSLAKLSGARLYVLPSKLILAPETALTADEKKKAKLYGVLLTTATLPDTPEAKALAKTNAQGKSILDIANIRISRRYKDMPIGEVMTGRGGPNNLDGNSFRYNLIGPIDAADLEELKISFILKDVRFGDALASYTHLLGLELYLTPTHFLICAPERLSGSTSPHWTKGAVPALQPFTPTIGFSENGS